MGRGMQICGKGGSDSLSKRGEDTHKNPTPPNVEEERGNENWKKGETTSGNSPPEEGHTSENIEGGRKGIKKSLFQRPHSNRRWFPPGRGGSG